jgi:hypothetical protein
MAKRKFLVYILVFLVSLAGFYFLGRVENFIWRAIFVLVGFIVLFEIGLYLFRDRKIEFSDGVGRYSMFCKNCGWEWMSHTTESEPRRCPNCGGEKGLEIIGWRKIKDFVKKKEQDLKKYIK